MTDYHQEIYQTATELAKKCMKSKIKLALAESCTGGWLAKSLTDITGSSMWFECAMITYSNESKDRLLGVSQSTLAQHGAVSEAVVLEMAKGVLMHSNATMSIAISGIAGPDGGSPEKPVGLVWFAIADKHGKRDITWTTQERIFQGDREGVRAQAVLFAQTMLMQLIESKN